MLFSHVFFWLLIDKGDGGLHQLYDEFSQSKILYAFCEAKDQNSQVSRYILINWVSFILVFYIDFTVFFLSKANVLQEEGFA